MEKLELLIDRVAQETVFSGVVRVDRDEHTEFARAYGFADRAHQILMTPNSQLAIASGSKGFTALAVMSLIEDGVLSLSTTARSVLKADLPLIADDVTVEHLLAHRSGIGDYLDDDAEMGIDDHPMKVGVHELATTEQFLPILDGYPTQFPAGERFAYCNGGFVVLALIAERVSGVDFHELVRQRVCVPAEMPDTHFFRSDNLPGRAASGYVTDGSVTRTNVFHLPVLGNGDGGIYSTLADLHRFWSMFLGGRIVGAATVREMLGRRSDRYGLGFHLHESTSEVRLEGSDFGVSFHSVHDPEQHLTWTVIGNTTTGAWPIGRAIRDRLTGGVRKNAGKAFS